LVFSRCCGFTDSRNQLRRVEAVWTHLREFFPCYGPGEFSILIKESGSGEVNHMKYGDEYFGSEQQQIVSRRSRDMWRLVRDNPQFCYNGRVVSGVGDIGPQTGEKLASLARLLGATTCHFLPKERTGPIQEDIEAQGLSTNIWIFCKGGQTAYEAAQKVLEEHELPADITVERLTAETDASRIQEFATMTADAGVLALSGRVMRGLDLPGITLAALDPSGRPVGSAWGYKCYHAQSGVSEYAFWGGLSCREDRRGQKIALVLGAHSIVQLWEEFEVRGFCTGIAEGNIASFSLCEKLGVFPSDQIGLGVTDPALFKGTTLTK
jgi:hypothetical protein